jgi:SAM-dependent methyltransferase
LAARETAAIQAYYDARAVEAIRDFVGANPRIERAWETLERTAGPDAPARILELGCGIGGISWRLARRWPGAAVTGLDISPQSIEYARRLFGPDGIAFVEGALAPGSVDGPIDLVVLFDVYEHVAEDERPELHRALGALLGSTASIVLSAPTPRHLARLRDDIPDEIQPVDEDVTVPVLLELASGTGTELVLYEEVGVWHERDYLHAVLRRGADWRPVERAGEPRRRFSLRHDASPAGTQSERERLVRERLGTLPGA